MAIVEYTQDEHVAIVTLNHGENRFNPEFLNAYLTILDEIETHTDARTLLVTSSHNRIFSNGIDLEWLLPVLQKQDIETAKQFFYLMNQVFKRTLLYPMTTVAMMNGHAFAGGAIWCCAFDFRFMRSDRGFFCLPEIDLGIPFLPGMNELLKKAIPIHALVNMQLTAKRWTANECEAHHIIQKSCPTESLMKETLAFSKILNKKREITREIKARLYKDIIHALDHADIPYIEAGNYHIGS